MSPLDYALDYARGGLYVFPVDANRAGRKIPAIPRWQLDASIDPDRIAAWWSDWPDAAVGLAHRLTGTVAIDIDTHDGRDGWATYLRHRLAGQPEPMTWAFGTASGGAQRVYARPVDLAALSGNYAGALGSGLDAIFGYSVLPSGDATPRRRWVAGNSPRDVMPAGAPGWMVEYAREKLLGTRAAGALATPAPLAPRPADDGPSMRYVAAALDGEVEAIRQLPDGQRQIGLARAAANVGRAVARAARPDLLAWCEDTIIGATDWTRAGHEVATVRRQLAWGAGVQS